MSDRRAPANGAPSRYAAAPDLEVSRRVSGGSTPLATALTTGPSRASKMSYLKKQKVLPMS